MSPSDDTKAPRRHSDHAFRAVADEGGLVVLPSEAKVQVLNPVGSKIYSMLDGKHTRGEIVRAVVEEFDVSEDQAAADLQAFLDQLGAENMLAGEGE